MTARPTQFRCLHCGNEYSGLYDPDRIQERTCPKCRSNSVRRQPAVKKTAEKR